MRRSWMMLALCAVLVPQAHAGGDKVHTVGKQGLKITGSIAEDDPKIKVTEPNVNVTVDLPGKVHQVKLQAGVKYRLELKGPGIDPILAVQDASGKQLGFDDDGGEGLDSLLDFQAPKEGSYKIVTASLKGAGDFTLTITQTGVGKVDTGVKAPGRDMTFEGRVGPDDPKVDLKGREFSAKLHEIKLVAGKSYQIDLVKKDGDLDPLLVVQNKAGSILALDDDGGDGLNSRLSFSCPKDDTYKIYAAALAGEGGYTLTIKEAGVGKVDGKVHDVGVRGLKFNGRLTNQERAITYQVKLEAGKTYVIDMVSPNQDKLDPFLKLVDPSGKQVADDDDGGGDLNSRITYRAPTSGTYRVIATPFQGLGDYVLDIRVMD